MIIEKIFPTPVVFSHIEREFTNNEYEFFQKLANECVQNTGNSRSKNGFVLECEELQDIRMFIQSKLDWYVSNIYSTPVQDNVSLRITQSWINITKPGQHHHQHTHRNSIVSGVLYLNASDDVDKILFYDKNATENMINLNQSEFNQFNSSSWFFPVSTGKLVLFPSWLPHSVPPTEHTDDRVSLAFNTFINGNLGSDDQSTYLEL